MSVLFESFELDFNEYSKKISKTYQSFYQIKQSQKEQSFLDIQQLIEQMNSCIKEMEKEIEGSRDRNLTKKVKKYQMQSDEQQKKLLKMKESYQKNKNKLNLFEKNKNTEKEQREQLISNTQKMDGQTEQFKGLNKVAYETENMTTNIQGALKDQREILLRNNQMNKDITQELTRTDRLLTLMRNREIMNKLILVVLIVFITIANLVIIFVKVNRYIKNYTDE